MEDPGTNDTICVLRLLYTAYLTLTFNITANILGDTKPMESKSEKDFNGM